MPEEEISLSELAPGSDEAALLTACLAAWDGWRGDRPMPRWRDVDMLDLPVTALPCVVVADVVGTGDNGSLVYRYRYWGTHLAEVHGKDMTGQTHEALTVDDFTDWTARVYAIVRERKAPLLLRGQFLSRSNVAYEDVTLRMPISEDGQTVDKILSVVLVLNGRETPFRDRAVA